MSPPSATGVDSSPDAVLSTVSKQTAGFPSAPKFDNPYKEREYLKGRLILAYRIFAKLGFDEGVAGHITLRVRY